MTEKRQHQCPSVSPDWEDSKAFAVVAGSAEQPEVAYLAEPAPVTQELLDLAGPVSPTEVFRFTAPCAGAKCQHFNSGTSQCQLVQQIVRWLPQTVDKPPPCAIRKDCVWWHQEGVQACRRCPQVVSENHAPSADFAAAVTPQTTEPITSVDPIDN